METSKVSGAVVSSSNGGVQVQRSSGEVSKDQVENAKKQKQADHVGINLSSKGKEIAEARAKALEIARSTPDIREEKVQELKQKIASGQYKVDAELVADGILREAIRDEVSKQ